MQVVFAFTQELRFDATNSEGMNLLVRQLLAKDGEEVQVGRIVKSLMRTKDHPISQLVEPLTKLSEYLSLRRDVHFEVFERRAEVEQTLIIRRHGIA
jgi:hypothetical protein